MLYLISTPIGNLGDMSHRAIETLKSLDLLLCEDTRHTKNLLFHFEISVSCQSYHSFNEKKQQEPILERLLAGEKIGLVSDAGTPGISDPGEALVKAAIEAGITVCPLPGPCALIQALVGSGLSCERFQFCGFVERKEQAKRKQLAEACFYPGTTVFYESPKRLLKTLQALPEEANVVVARELTKKFESYHRGCAKELIAHFSQEEPRGECVLLLEGSPEAQWEQLDPKAHAELIMQTWELDKKEAIKLVAKLRGVQKRALYDELQQ